MNEKEKMEKLKLYLAKALKDVKRFEKSTDEELYQRGVDVTKAELKKGKQKLFKYLKIRTIEQMIEQYEFFMYEFDSISKYFAKCDEMVISLKNEVSIL